MDFEPKATKKYIDYLSCDSREIRTILLNLPSPTAQDESHTK